MTLPLKDYYSAAKLTFKAFADPTDVKTIWVTDRAITSSDPDSVIYWPLITEISELGSEMDEFILRETEASIVLNNEIGSFGAARKIADLLERYTLIDQRIEIYLKAVAYGAADVVFEAADLVWLGKVATVDLDIDSDPTLIISAIASLIPHRQVGYQLTETDSDESQSVGKYLPVPFGNYCYMPLYRIKDPNVPVAFAIWAYASIFCEWYGDMTNILAQDADGLWVETETFTSAYAKGTETTSYSLDSSSTVKGRLFEISNASSKNGIVFAVSFSMEANGYSGRTSACVVTATVYGIPIGQEPTPRNLASGTYELVDDDALNNAGTDFTMTIQLDRAVVMNAATHYYAVAVTQSGYQVAEASIFKSQSGTCRTWTKTDTGDWLAGGTIKAPAMEAHIMDQSSFGLATARNAEGFGFMYVSAELSDNSPIDAYESLNLQAKTSGHADDASGTFSGIANSQITRPDQVVKMITGAPTGDAWPDQWEASNDWDFTTYATEYLAAYGDTRLLVGYQDAPVTLRDMLETMCRDSASRIGITNAGKLFLWPWGYNYTPAAHIGPEDMEPVSWSVNGVDTIVNQVSMSYGNTNIDVIYLRNKKQTKNFSGLVDYTVPLMGDSQDVAKKSQSLYGRRYLDVTETNYIGTIAAANALADSIFKRYAKPLVTAKFNVSLDTFRALKLLDVITFTHPAFPSFIGAASDSNAPSGPDSARVDLKAGRYWTEATRHRGLIEARRIIKDAAGVPILQIEVQVLQNKGVDPT